jgi:haloalkane dehalogenase
VIPAWVDRAQYPFEPRAFASAQGTMRYLDEGDGPAVVMVHGTPTWSFLYRHLVTGLRPRFRCVVPDLLGFGLSDKPPGASYRPEDQAARLTAFIDALGLKDLTLIVHDFGGPIGLAYALDHPENVGKLVLFNTWMWSLAGEPRYEWFGRLLGGAVGRLLYERAGFSVRVMFRHAIGDRTRYPRTVARHYEQPLATSTERRATWWYARAVLGSGRWYEELWRRRETLRHHPALLIWGMKDPAFGALLPRWRTVFERVDVVELADAGHAPPEERGPELVSVIERFLREETRA